MKHHHETHIASSESLRDLVLGMADGLTVPFALAAGLSGAVDSTRLIVTAGLAEIAAGAIAMGLGGYLATRTQAQHYASEYRREAREVQDVPHVEAQEVADILREFGVPAGQVPVVVEGIRRRPEKWVDFMMRFELGLERPDPKRLVLTPLIIGLAYVAGGIVPLAPYMLTNQVSEALPVSILLTLMALFVFGAFKGHFTGMPRLTSALQTTLVGSAAAACAYMIAAWIS